MKVFVHVKDKMITVQCGAGSQPISWLADVGIMRYDPFYGLETGLPAEVHSQNHVLLPKDGPISDLTDGAHVYILLKGKFEMPRFR